MRPSDSDPTGSQTQNLLVVTARPYFIPLVKQLRFMDVAAVEVEYILVCVFW